MNVGSNVLKLIKIKTRLQGSNYIYDLTNPEEPLFYQLDEWHEAKHPNYWSKNIEIEADLFDSKNQENLRLISTNFKDENDFTDVKTKVITDYGYSVNLASGNHGWLNYNFQVRKTNKLRPTFLINLKSGASSGKLKYRLMKLVKTVVPHNLSATESMIEVVAPTTLNIVNGVPAWVNPTTSFQNLIQQQDYVLQIIPDHNLEFDKIKLIAE
jgi:hypothetical protein